MPNYGVSIDNLLSADTPTRTSTKHRTHSLTQQAYSGILTRREIGRGCAS